MPILLFTVPTRSVLQWLREEPVAFSVLVACVVASVATFFLVLCYYRAASRYLYEFTPLLFPLILCNVAVWWKQTEVSPASRNALKAGITAVCILNVIGGVCLGLNGMRH